MTFPFQEFSLRNPFTITTQLDCEKSLFRLVHRARRERNPRVKNGRTRSWGREASVLLAPRMSPGLFLLSWASFASRSTDETKEGLLAAYDVTTLRH